MNKAQTQEASSSKVVMIELRLFETSVFNNRGLRQLARDAVRHAKYGEGSRSQDVTADFDSAVITFKVTIR